MELIVSFFGGGILAGIVAAVVSRILAPGQAERIRHDEEREAALADVIERSAELEQYVDFILSPDHGAPSEAVLDTRLLIGTNGRIDALLSSWRANAEPFLPATAGLAESIVPLWHAGQEAAHSNPPPDVFYDRIRALKEAVAELRRAIQEQRFRRLRPRRRPR
jgi:hypothetical protein